MRHAAGSAALCYVDFPAADDVPAAVLRECTVGRNEKNDSTKAGNRKWVSCFLFVVNFPMPAEAAADVVDISHCLYMAANGFVADAQCHAQLFGADFVVLLDERNDFGIQIVLEDTLRHILGDTLGDILRDTVIQIRHDDRKLVAVRTECGALGLGVVDLHLVAVWDFAEAAALALHVAQPIEYVGQHRVAPGGRHSKRVTVLDHRPA